MNNNRFSQMPAERRPVMRALTEKFAAAIEDKKVLEEYAFNCSEIFGETLQFNWLIEKILQQESASVEDISAIEGFLAIHWHYHTAELRKAMHRWERLETKKEEALAKAQEQDTQQKEAGQGG